ncbi:MAG: bifunctional precorrin-2 dehydrogenase/sirohydrochlorin ferrochelatase, partial [Syntrophales bacterium]|nr:bifunctional precorrin-2 dehydrogenase/sirohydrochlorin ferrochelatase [Syntrophales bacterium]
MKYYPIYMDIADKSCIVIGGGEVAQRKVLRLLECGARVTVISKALTSVLQELARNAAIVHMDAEYDPVQVAGAFLVIGATDRDTVNEQICSDCREQGIIVNIVDNP